MRKNLFAKILFFAGICLLSTYLKGQVSIGSREKPLKGTLLDLKEDGTTTEGLAMPRVKLKSLEATNSDLKTTIDGATGTENWDLNQHIGLLVYNVEEDLCASFFIF